MPRTLRLGISITSIRRIFGDDNFHQILTQNDLGIISQRGENFVTQDAPVSADFITTTDPLLTQDGNFISLNQNPIQLLVLDQDFEVSGNHLETQDAQALVTQAGEGLITERVRS